ncbi:HNH endonuclease [Streptomyces chrestomyceticus]|uniref:HNH endonuclease n=1 Tax=Streptomyces chrestomyceticus TaxID=68185 RepID=UPI0035A97079
MSAKRPAVPRDLRRRVLVEAGHRCAIPTCRATPVEIAHIIPWAKVKKHEFSNLIALCPNCHTHFDSPHGPLDRKSMREYKANLNPLLSLNLIESKEQIARLTAYQEMRAEMTAWVKSIHAHAAAKSRKRSTISELSELREREIERSSWAICSALDFQSAWKGGDASGIAGWIFYRVAEWADEVDSTDFPIPKQLAKRDISSETSEAATLLHLAICEDLGILSREGGENISG